MYKLDLESWIFIGIFELAVLAYFLAEYLSMRKMDKEREKAEKEAKGDHLRKV